MTISVRTAAKSAAALVISALTLTADASATGPGAKARTFLSKVPRPAALRTSISP
jgi:hypothetical protein